MTEQSTPIALAEQARAALPESVRSGSRLMTIGGQQVPAASGRTLPNVDPTTEVALADVPRGGTEDVDAAVQAATKAFHDPSWADLDPHRRSQILHQVAAVIEENAEELATIDAVSMGSPIVLARGMVDGLAQEMRHAAGWPTKIYGQTAPTAPNRLGYTRRQPLGVVGAIWGWNGPMVQLGLKLPALLATGNTAVLKPPESASLSTVRLVELLGATDLPPGVINVVTGTGSEAGEALLQHPGVAKIAFTGSTRTGKHVHSAVSDTLKHVTLELGGKSPTIVFPDADLDAAAQGAASAFILGTGQACVAGTRLFVHEAVREPFVERLQVAMAAFTMGDPLDPATLVGPLASRQHFDRVCSYFDIAREEGATVTTGGTRASDTGFFVAPTLLDNVTSDMRVVQEEIFGPVTALMPFSDVDDVIAQANNTVYGLSANIWTRDLSTAHRLAARLDVGTVWVNTYGEILSQLPFGGFKQSGLGREGGLDVIDAYTQSKTVLIALEDRH